MSSGVDEIKNKLRTLYAGKKTDLVIGNIAKTFRALCDLADFATPMPAKTDDPLLIEPEIRLPLPGTPEKTNSDGKIHVSGLQYHINIVLPDTRDQAVYDAIFKSLRDHLG